MLPITQADLFAVVRIIGEGVRSSIDESVCLLKARIVELETRIAELAARPELKYMGVFKQGDTYTPGMLATHHGSLWHCHEETTKAPPSSEWQLCAKRGRDGKDGNKCLA